MLSYYWSGVELESELESKCGKEENSMPIPTPNGSDNKGTFQENH